MSERAPIQINFGQGPSNHSGEGHQGANYQRRTVCRVRIRYLLIAVFVFVYWGAGLEREIFFISFLHLLDDMPCALAIILQSCLLRSSNEGRDRLICGLNLCVYLFRAGLGAVFLVLGVWLVFLIIKLLHSFVYNLVYPINGILYSCG